MLEGLLVTIVLGYAFSYIALSVIRWWDEIHCRTHWEHVARWHQGFIDSSETGWLARRYHRWRLRATEAKLARYWSGIRAQTEALLNTPPPERQPEHTESSRPY